MAHLELEHLWGYLFFLSVLVLTLFTFLKAQFNKTTADKPTLNEIVI